MTIHLQGFDDSAALLSRAEGRITSINATRLQVSSSGGGGVIPSLALDSDLEWSGETFSKVPGAVSSRTAAASELLREIRNWTISRRLTFLCKSLKWTLWRCFVLTWSLELQSLCHFLKDVLLLTFCTRSRIEFPQKWGITDFGYFCQYYIWRIFAKVRLFLWYFPCNGVTGHVQTYNLLLQHQWKNTEKLLSWFYVLKLSHVNVTSSNIS